MYLFLVVATAIDASTKFFKVYATLPDAKKKAGEISRSSINGTEIECARVYRLSPAGFTEEVVDALAIFINGDEVFG